ncbi:hypothetical protein F5Y08DRAFT_344855 [Xylaria arbuscula]|nr:hypothetical protein F5Y08DRAFT_344855 [Xylaria arbuscula]
MTSKLTPVLKQPRLMREGFHWDTSNVIREEGYFDKDFYEWRDRKQWSSCRHYFLRDLKEPPLWIATMRFVAVSDVIISVFNLNELSRANIRLASAYNQSGQLIYHYHHENTFRRCNTIYDDMPMEGWWPWPRVHEKQEGELVDRKAT